MDRLDAKFSAASGRCDARCSRYSQKGWPFDHTLLAAHPETGGRWCHTRRVAVLDPEKSEHQGHGFRVDPNQRHNTEWLKRFSEVVQEFPEVIEFYRMLVKSTIF